MQGRFQQDARAKAKGSLGYGWPVPAPCVALTGHTACSLPRAVGSGWEVGKVVSVVAFAADSAVWYSLAGLMWIFLFMPGVWLKIGCSNGPFR